MTPLDEVARRAREGGMRVTPQRLAVYRALAASHDHPDPDTLHRRLLPEQPTISLATVYKTLDALLALGLVRQVPVAGSAKRYDAKLDRHHHAICERCRRVSDVHDARLDRVAAPAGIEGFAVHTVTVQMLGTCADCSRKGRAAARAVARNTRRR
jgi:Fur family peroxide stress response transcriptional regulator